MYLLSLPVFSLSEEEMQKIKKQILDKRNDLEILENQSIKDMWRNDLQSFLEELAK